MARSNARGRSATRHPGDPDSWPIPKATSDGPSALQGNAGTRPRERPDLALLVCPLCHGDLLAGESHLACPACAREYTVTEGIADLQVAAGFDDEDHVERWSCEEGTGRFMIERYMVPLLERLFPDRERSSLRLLSIGCGVGVDAEALESHGYRCHGIDVGNRAKIWIRRRNPQNYTRAAVQKMPFRTGAFDFAFLNCVLPHVGVVGDSQSVAPDYIEQRSQSVAETVRVVRPGGFILVSNPNRLCPLDLFHRKNERTHMPRIHALSEPFLQSFGDHYRDFVGVEGCRGLQTLPPANFWGFSATSKSSRYALGRVLQVAIRGYFRILSLPWLSPMRRTPLNPWLVVLVSR